MLMPIGDEPNPRGFALVNTVLIGINVAVYALISLPLMFLPPDPLAPGLTEYLITIARSRGIDPIFLYHEMSAYDLFVFENGYRAVDPSFQTLLCSIFLHGSLLHLAGNMLFLWIYGDNVEARLGRVPYLLCYVVTGAIATLSHAYVSPDLSLPMIGASGAISGVLGFYWVWFPHNRIRILFWFYWIVDVIVVPARLVLGFYLVVENLIPFLLAPSGGGIAHGAHLGGFVAGVLLAYVIGPGEDSPEDRTA